MSAFGVEGFGEQSPGERGALLCVRSGCRGCASMLDCVLIVLERVSKGACAAAVGLATLRWLAG